MKIKDKIACMLIANGLFPLEAEEVIKRYVASAEAKPMAGRMNDDESEYPPQVVIAVWIGAQRHALEWIDENVPKHWARPLFTGELDK